MTDRAMDSAALRLMGYSNRWSLAPGERIDFMVSCPDERFRVDIVRLFQGDDGPDAPPYREEAVAASCAGDYPGKVQPLRPGSYLRAPNPVRGLSDSWTVTLWVAPAAVGRGEQTILSLGPDGVELGMDAEGRPYAVCGGLRLVIARRLRERRWHFIALAVDRERGTASLHLTERNILTAHLDTPRWERMSGDYDGASMAHVEELSIAARRPSGGEAFFNGRVADPRFYRGLLEEGTLARLRDRDDDAASACVAAWAFGTWPFTADIPSLTDGKPARIVNHPTRGITGPFWDGSAQHFRDRPDHYDAIHFHDDDLADAGWDTDFGWAVPGDLPSGVYAARLTAGDQEDYLPFVVTPAAPGASILVVLPTFTYLAYANETWHQRAGVDWSVQSAFPLSLSTTEAFVAATPALGRSIYDRHSDESFCCTSSLLRPVLNFRPKQRSYWTNAPRHFVADLFLLDWLDRAGRKADVVTDHDVHRDGAGLLTPYRLVILGSHPEYISHEIRQALDAHVAAGGKLLYPGGNGCWWVSGLGPEAPHILEVRKNIIDSPVRGIGMGPGEGHLATNGAMGGTWRGIGQPPEALFGVGFGTQGWCAAQGYRRRPDSLAPEFAPLFEGIAADEIIGDFGLAMGGAAGDEFDRGFPDGASPPGMTILASSFGHPAAFNMNFTTSGFAAKADKEAALRSDITYYRTANGGAVFAAGSMCWLPSLAWNNYDNNVARLTANAIDFLLK